MKYCPACRASFDLDFWLLICAQIPLQVFCRRKAVALAVLDKAKAVLLEHDVVKFAATALGQIINALYGVKVVSSASFCLCFCMLAINKEGPVCAWNHLGPSFYPNE